MSEEAILEDAPVIPQFAEVDSEMVGLVMAFHGRRIMARNAVVEYATNMKSPPLLEAMAVSDLHALYEDLGILEEAMKSSEDLYEIIAIKRMQAESLIESVRSGDLSEEDTNESVKQAVILQREIEKLVLIMERLAGAS
jgi:hypothetical protein